MSAVMTADIKDEKSLLFEACFSDPFPKKKSRIEDSSWKSPSCCCSGRSRRCSSLWHPRLSARAAHAWLSARPRSPLRARRHGAGRGHVHGRPARLLRRADQRGWPPDARAPPSPPGDPIGFSCDAEHGPSLKSRAWSAQSEGSRPGPGGCSSNPAGRDDFIRTPWPVTARHPSAAFAARRPYRIGVRRRARPLTGEPRLVRPVRGQPAGARRVPLQSRRAGRLYSHAVAGHSPTPGRRLLRPATLSDFRPTPSMDHLSRAAPGPPSPRAAGRGPEGATPIPQGGTTLFARRGPMMAAARAPPSPPGDPIGLSCDAEHGPSLKSRA